MALTEEVKSTPGVSVEEIVSTSAANPGELRGERKISESIDLTGGGTPNVSDPVCAVWYLFWV